MNRVPLAALTYGALLATIVAHTWFAGTPLPLGGPNVVLGGAAVLLALSLALGDLLAGKRLVLVKNLVPLAAISVLLMIWAASVHIVNETGTWLRVGKMALGIGILFAVYLTVTSAGRAWLMIATGVLAAVVSVLFGLAVVYLGDPFWSFWLDVSAPLPDQVYSVLGGRIAGLSNNIISLAYLLTVAVPSALAMFLYYPSLRGRSARLAWDGVLGGVMMILLAAMITNATRSMLLGVIFGSVLVVALPALMSPTLSRQTVRRLCLIVALAATGIALLVMVVKAAERRPPPPTIGDALTAAIVAMPAPVTGCFESLGTLSGEMFRSASWSGDCPGSLRREGSYARHYGFILGRDSAVAIDLASTEEANAYLYLFVVTEAGAREVGRNDNLGGKAGMGRMDARIVDKYLRAGDYVIEATTYRPATPGEFTLTVRTSTTRARAGPERPAIDRIFSFGDTSFQSRLPMAVVALRRALQHPLGTAEYTQDGTYISDDMDPWVAVRILQTSPHNQFLEVLVYYGFPGLVLVLSFYVYVLRSLLRCARMAMRNRDTEAFFLIAVVAGSLAAYLIHSQFHPPGPFVDDWYHFFLIGLLFGIQRICHDRSEPSWSTDVG